MTVLCARDGVEFTFWIAFLISRCDVSILGE